MDQAIALYQFKGVEDGELSVLKSEILDVMEKMDSWWKVKNKYGEFGLVPVTYLAAPVTSDIKVLQRGKIKQPHSAGSQDELSVKIDDQVAVLDNSDDYWWLVGFYGRTGFIPKSIISVLKSNKSNAKDKEKDVLKFSFKEAAPDKAQCDEETTVLLSFQKELPPQGNFIVVFKGEHCQKTVDATRLNDFTLKIKTPKYYPAETTKITINHQQPGQPQQMIAKGVHFTFLSKLDIVHKILSRESDPIKFLCASYQIEHGEDLENVDRILSLNLEKKVPESIDLLKSSKSVLVQDQVHHPKETPTLLHFAAYYNLKKLAKSLLRCPGAKEAMSIKNCHGNGPVGVAQLKKHSDMEELLQDLETVDIDDNVDDYYTSMEDCYERYTKMDGTTYQPEYIVPNNFKKNSPKFNAEDDIYEDMDGGKKPQVEDPQQHYDKPRSERDDRFEPYDDELDNNSNKVLDDSEMQKRIDEYKVFGRMTEKEVQLALLMKRVKERYITQEQALEMAKVLHLEPEAPGKASKWKKQKPKVTKRVSAPDIEVQRKGHSLPSGIGARTMSTSSGSSVGSVGSSGSAASSGYTSDSVARPAAPPVKPPLASRPFSYFGSPQAPVSKPPVSPKRSVSPPTPARRIRAPTDPAPPVPTRRGPRQ